MHNTKIMSRFPCAIDYDDLSALDGAESRALEDWLNANQAEAEDRYGEHAQVLYEYGDESEFAECDILGVRGHCVEVNVIVLY
jgi:hypothetical protein